MPYPTRHLLSLSRPCASSSGASHFGLWRTLFSLWLFAACVFALPRTSHAQSFNSLFSFSGPDDGTNPYAGLIQASDGNFYGTTYNGGPYAEPYGYGDGTVFRITAGGTLTTLYRFTGGTDGSDPSAGLIQATDGCLYGTTTYGGANGSGTIFKITTGGAFTSLYNFSALNWNGSEYTNSDGANPNGLIQAKDGKLYGTTEGGGANGSGTVFRITTGGKLTTLYSFTGGSDGYWPLAGLIQAKDGNFYSTTYGGGAYGSGTVFRITTGGKLTTLYSFSTTDSNGTNADGANPYAGLTQASDGNLYGTTSWGGGSGFGTVFRITTGGRLTTLYTFAGESDGGNPWFGSLIQANDGDLYGTTVNGGARAGYNGSGTVFRITTRGTLTTLYRFSALGSTYTNADGANPYAGLIQASDGNLYGTTEGGGAYTSGTVVRITTGGTLTTLHNFTGGTDGAKPSAGVVQASDGNLYGTTRIGGMYNWGSVFRISTDGTLTTLYSFTDGSDGAYPYGGLIQASDGNLYGTTAGTYSTYTYNNGTVFRITTEGKLTTLYSFTGGTDGSNLYAGLIQASDGNLYGTALGGAYGSGTVFRITIGGKLTTLYSFGTTSTDGSGLYVGLIQAKDGNLYGTTWAGGTDNGGTVFQITTEGKLTTLYSFGSNPSDGAGPNDLMQAKDGNLYGTTGGGANGDGTVFRITTEGKLTSLYSFTGTTDGAYPSGLMQAKDGNLYGTTGGGANGDGTVFRIATGGTLTTLYTFSTADSNGTNADGAGPSGLIQAKDGNLYGTTYGGGDYDLGTIYSLDLGPPTLASLSPSSSNAGGPAFTLTLNGSAFASDSTVEWTSGGITTALTTTYVTGSHLTAEVPVYLIANPGTAIITVASGSGIASNGEPFTINVTTLKLSSAKLTQNSAGNYSAKISLQNEGYLTAPDVTITQATLGTAATSTTLPVSVGSIAPGKTGSTSLSFPSSAGSSGTVVTLNVTGTFTGGIFSASLKVKLP